MKYIFEFQNIYNSEFQIAGMISDRECGALDGSQDKIHRQVK